MEATVPSRSALRVALRRAAHQLYDERPLVFEDPLAVAMLGPHAAELARTPGRGLGRRKGERVRVHSFSLRAFLVARSRHAEDLLAAAYARGVRQYVLLGAGLDTFAYRSAWPGLRVFEVDHPATQAWKQELVERAGISAKAELTRVALDLEAAELRSALRAAGVDAERPVFFACMGVVPYLSAGAFARMLRIIGSPGGEGVLDYRQPREEQGGFDRLAYDSMAARVGAAGEPFRMDCTRAELADELALAGLEVEEDVGAEELNGRYFAGRGDGLRVLAPAGRLVSFRARARAGAGPSIL